MKKKSKIQWVKTGVMVLFLAVGSFAYAQPGGQGGRPNPGERFDHMLNVLVDSVGINEAQTVKAKAINEKYKKVFEEARTEMQNGGDREQMRQKFRSTMVEYDKEITALLTDEQKVTYEKVKANRRAEMQKNRGNRPQPEGGQRAPRGGR